MYWFGLIASYLVFLIYFDLLGGLVDALKEFDIAVLLAYAFFYFPLLWGGYEVILSIPLFFGFDAFGIFS